MSEQVSFTDIDSVCEELGISDYELELSIMKIIYCRDTDLRDRLGIAVDSEALVEDEMTECDIAMSKLMSSTNDMKEYSPRFGSTMPIFNKGDKRDTGDSNSNTDSSPDIIGVLPDELLREPKYYKTALKVSLRKMIDLQLHIEELHILHCRSKEEPVDYSTLYDNKDRKVLQKLGRKARDFDPVIVKNLFANGADVTTVCNIVGCDRKTFENWTLRIYGKQPKEVKKMYSGILQHKARTGVIKHAPRNANAAIFLARATGAMDDRVVAGDDSSSGNGSGGSGGGIKAIVFGSAVELQKMGGIGIVDVNSSEVTDVTPVVNKQIGHIKDPNKDCYDYSSRGDDTDDDSDDLDVNDIDEEKYE